MTEQFEEWASSYFSATGLESFDVFCEMINCKVGAKTPRGLGIRICISCGGYSYLEDSLENELNSLPSKDNGIA